MALRLLLGSSLKSRDLAEDAVSKRTLLKQTLVRSPIVTNVFPNFTVDTTKPLTGLPVEKSSDQYLVPKIDSQLDDFSDIDEDILQFDTTLPLLAPPNAILSQESIAADDLAPLNVESDSKDTKIAPDMKDVKILVKITSIVVDDEEYGFMAPIRSSCLLPGQFNTGRNEYDEDSLLISLKSGFILLIKIYLVPQNMVLHPERPIAGKNVDSGHIYKPYIVQWWDTTNEGSISTMMSSGYSIHCNSQGTSVACMSGSDVFRIQNVEKEPISGLTMLGAHTNVPVEGVILNACFAGLLDTAVANHVMLLLLVFTESRRLEIFLYQWNSSEPIRGNLTKHVLPLNNSFPIPVHIVALTNNPAFIFISPDEAILISIHSILSGGYDFLRLGTNMPFPTSIYTPESRIKREFQRSNLKSNDSDEDMEPIHDESNTNEILIASEKGSIFSLIIEQNNSMKIEQIARIADPIALFVMERLPDDTFYLFYVCDTGSNRELVISKLFENNNVNKQYSQTRVLYDYKNWAPIIDVIAIDAYKQNNINNYTDQELWTLAGFGKRTKLLQLRTGIIATRLTGTFADLRKGLAIFFHNFFEKNYFIVSFAEQTRIFEYGLKGGIDFDDVEDDQLLEIEEFPLRLDASTILFVQMDQIYMQIVETGILILNMKDEPIVAEFPDRRITIASRLGKLILLVSEDLENNVNVEVLKIDTGKIDFVRDLNISDFAHVLYQASLDFQVCMATLVCIENKNCCAVGYYNGELILIPLLDPSSARTIQLSKLHSHLDEELLGHFFAPHSILYFNELRKLIVGTKDGFLIEFSLENELNFYCDKFLKISDTAVSLQHIVKDPKNTNHDVTQSYIILSRNLWLSNFADGGFPQKVFFNEISEKASFAGIQIASDEHPRSFAFIREDGFSISTLTSTPTTSTKLVSLREPASKILYIDYLNTFMVLLKSEDAKSKFRFIDRKTLKQYDQVENSRNKWLLADSSIIEEDEVPLCTSIWSVKRHNSLISKKILVGFLKSQTKGSIKILDISLTSGEDGNNKIAVRELNSFECKEPVSCIVQINSCIIFSAVCSLNSTSYNLAEKRLNPVLNLAMLPSPIVSLDVTSDETLLVTTKSDSIYKFKYTNGTTCQEGLHLVAKDPSPRSLVNEAQIELQIIVSDKLHSSILLMETSGDLFKSVLTYKLSCISKVISTKFWSIWATKKRENANVICVGINGEIVSFRVAEDNQISGIIEESSNNFFGKVTGKGLFHLNEPYFNYKENRVSIVDYDQDPTRASGYMDISL